MSPLRRAKILGAASKNLHISPEHDGSGHSANSKQIRLYPGKEVRISTPRAPPVPGPAKDGGLGCRLSPPPEYGPTSPFRLKRLLV